VARRLIPDIIYCSNPYEAADGADALVVVTEWKEFKRLDLLKIQETGSLENQIPYEIASNNRWKKYL